MNTTTSTEDKTGILILDDDVHHASFAPDEIIDTLYVQMLEGYSGDVTQFDFMENSLSTQEAKTNNSLLHFDQDVISPVDMMSYKLVIYHSDKAGGGSNFHRNSNSFNSFFQMGGNMVASLGDNAQNVYDKCNLNSLFLLEDNFGIDLHIGDDAPDQVVKIASSPLTNPFLIGADATDGFETDLDLELDDVWLTLVGLRKGLGPCSYFTEDVSAEAIYTYRCKPVDSPDFPPDQEQYDMFNGQTIAVKYITETNSNYMFGVSLPFMEIEDVRAMFNEIFEDLGM